MGQDGDELCGVAEGGADGVSRVNVVQLCGKRRSKVRTGSPETFSNESFLSTHIKILIIKKITSKLSILK